MTRCARISTCRACHATVLRVTLGGSDIVVDVLAPSYVDGAGFAAFAHHGRTCSAVPSDVRAADPNYFRVQWPPGTQPYEDMWVVPP